VNGEVDDTGSLASAMRGHETVIHLASKPDIARAVTDPDMDFVLRCRDASQRLVRRTVWPTRVDRVRPPRVPIMWPAPVPSSVVARWRTAVNATREFAHGQTTKLTFIDRLGVWLAPSTRVESRIPRRQGGG
jgi:hypothetical protein